MEIIPVDHKIVVDPKVVYKLLDNNLYIKREQKLRIYRQLQFISCNSNSFTSVVYDKATKKAQRRFVFELDTYNLVMSLYEILVDG